MNTAHADWLADLYSRTRCWFDGDPPEVATARTPAYFDLLFAFVHASLGDQAATQRLLTQARLALHSTNDDAHQFLLAAFEYRIERALAGLPYREPLSPELQHRLETVPRLARYQIDRFRMSCELLDPDRPVAIYRFESINRYRDERVALEAAVQPDAFVKQARQTIRKFVPWATHRADDLMMHILSRAETAGSDFVREMLDVARQRLFDWQPAFADDPSLQTRRRLLWQTLDLAHTTGDRNTIASILSRVQQWIERGESDLSGAVLLLPLLLDWLFERDCCDDADQFLHQTATLVLAGRPLAQWDFGRDETLPRLYLLLSLSRGWNALGWDRLSRPVLESALDLVDRIQNNNLCSAGQLPQPRIPRVLVPLDSTRRVGSSLVRLERAVVESVTLAPYDVAHEQLNLLAGRLQPGKDTYTTHTHYSVFRVCVLEELLKGVLAVCRRC